MKARIRNSKLPKKTLWLMLGFLMLIYFSYHLVYGPRGIVQHYLLSQNLQVQQQEMASLNSSYDVLNARVSRLRNGSLDLDLLEERAQVMLGRGGAKDVLVFEGVSL